LLCHLRHELIVSFSQVPLFLSKQASKQARPKEKEKAKEWRSTQAKKDTEEKSKAIKAWAD